MSRGRGGACSRLGPQALTCRSMCSSMKLVLSRMSKPSSSAVAGHRQHHPRALASPLSWALGSTALPAPQEMGPPPQHTFPLRECSLTLLRILGQPQNKGWEGTQGTPRPEAAWGKRGHGSDWGRGGHRQGMEQHSQCSALMVSWKSCLVFFFMMDSQAPISTQPRDRGFGGEGALQALLAHTSSPCPAPLGTSRAPSLLSPELQHLQNSQGLLPPLRFLRRLSRRCSCFSPFSSWDTKSFICLMSMPRRRCGGRAGGGGLAVRDRATGTPRQGGTHIVLRLQVP